MSWQSSLAVFRWLGKEAVKPAATKALMGKMMAKILSMTLLPLRQSQIARQTRAFSGLFMLLGYGGRLQGG